MFSGAFTNFWSPIHYFRFFLDFVPSGDVSSVIYNVGFFFLYLVFTCSLLFLQFLSPGLV